LLAAEADMELAGNAARRPVRHRDGRAPPFRIGRLPGRGDGVAGTVAAERAPAAEHAERLARLRGGRDGEQGEEKGDAARHPDQEPRAGRSAAGEGRTVRLWIGSLP